MKRVYDRHAWVLDERRVEARHLPLRAARYSTRDHSHRASAGMPNAFRATRI